ncbi:MAG: UbiH/UbiF/VisC/COQ6 family ubiquinone biosynthesis hydroxylase [Herminiimonas sp.]|nr:UbiH/UbiF/VisC/COQ6 family ubiquinone biosynthesis hydroxylase [Herminiimonas sp.]MDB5855216.1 UbiH/UbiF/VisC/COQ6 family ubiquinone biosynthesis hydroxylase [Herminiimonas sp.]
MSNDDETGHTSAGGEESDMPPDGLVVPSDASIAPLAQSTTPAVASSVPASVIASTAPVETPPAQVAQVPLLPGAAPIAAKALSAPPAVPLLPMPEPLHVDIAICGGGPVGMALALFLMARGVPAQSIALIDAKPITEVERDPRALALSWGSRQLLEQVHAWPAATTPIAEIHVSRRGHFGRTLIDCKEYDLPALGYVTRYGALVSALNAVVDKSTSHVLRPGQVSAMTETEERVSLVLAGGERVEAGIVVQAEGGVFNDQSQRALTRDYGQTAIVAHVSTSAPLLSRAFERFTDEGPLALLPQDGGYAMVWCMRPANAERLMAQDDAVFLANLQHAFGERVGAFLSVTPRHSYPLGLNARPGATPRSISIGNAAQTLHPVAGQGLNLGLRDAVVLARMLAEEISPATLQRFGASRRNDRGTTIHLTDLMARLFASTPDGSLRQSMLGLSLGLIDAVKPARRLLAEQMMFGQR